MKEPYSYHIFLFPFRWYGKNREDFTQELNTEKIWDEDFFEVKTEDKEYGHLNYNEQVFFYDFVNEAIHWKTKNQKNIAAYKLKQKHINAKYRINHFRKDDETDFMECCSNGIYSIWHYGYSFLNYLNKKFNK